MQEALTLWIDGRRLDFPARAVIGKIGAMADPLTVSSRGTLPSGMRSERFVIVMGFGWYRRLAAAKEVVYEIGQSEGQFTPAQMGAVSAFLQFIEEHASDFAAKEHSKER